MKTRILLWLFAGSMMSCSPRISSPSAGKSKISAIETEERNKPDWVTKKLAMDGYYVGVGSAKTYQQDYHRIAKDKALEDMLSEIRVKIEASSFLYQNEFGDHFSENYESYIKTTSSEELSDFELLNEWNDGNEYWITYRLSRSKYHQAKKQKIDIALALATEHLEIARLSEKQGEFLTAINNYLTTVDILKNHLKEPLSIRIDGNEQLIIPYCSQAIQKIFNDLRIEEDQVSLNPLSSSAGIITLTCRGLTVKGFSLMHLDRRFISNQNGQLVMAMDQIVGQPSLSLTISMDMLKVSLKDNVILNKFIDSFNRPKFDIPVSVRSTTLHIEGEEYNLGSNLERQMIMPELVNLLSAYQFVFIDNPQKSDFRFAYKITTRQGNEASGLYVCWADVEISLYNSANERIYSDQLLNVKGIHSSYTSAGAKAIENVAPLLKEKIIYPFIKNVF